VGGQRRSESGDEKKNPEADRNRTSTAHPVTWAILVPCTLISVAWTNWLTVAVEVLRHWRSWWLPPTWARGLVLLVSEPERGNLPLLIAAGMSCGPDARRAGEAAAGGSASRCDSYRTSKYNVNFSHYRRTSRFVLWRPRCVRSLTLRMLPVTVHCTAFEVTVLGSSWKLNPSVIEGLILGTEAGYRNWGFCDFNNPWK
jgi:hypothetical protein